MQDPSKMYDLNELGFLRHHASKPPPASSKPGKPAPAMGPGTAFTLIASSNTPPLFPPITSSKLSVVFAELATNEALNICQPMSLVVEKLAVRSEGRLTEL